MLIITIIVTVITLTIKINEFNFAIIVKFITLTIKINLISLSLLQSSPSPSK